MSYNLTSAAYGGNMSFGKAGLAAGTTSTYSIGNQFDYTIKGQFYRKAAAANAAMPTTDRATGKAFVPLAANESCIFGFYVDANGTVAVIQGPKANTGEFTGGLAALQFPQCDDTLTPFGYAMASASGALAAPWALGSGNTSGVTGLTLTFRDMMDFPAQPIVG
jgi:hypothetical protein